MRRSLALSFSLIALVLALQVALAAPGSATPESMTIEVTYPESLHEGPLDGRLYLMFSSDEYDGSEDGEPRFKVANWRGGQPMFAIDVEDWRPGEPAVFDAEALGFPIDSLAEMPTGDYVIQVMLNVYTEVTRSDGHTIKVPLDRWEGQNWRIKPGNLYSDVTARAVGLDPSEAGSTMSLELANEIPPRPAYPEDTEYLKYRRFRSEILSEFWGTDIDLGAIVLLPPGFEDNPEARYPVAYYQGHFHDTFYTPVGFSPEPPDPSLEGYDYTYAEASHRFYQQWTSGELPKFIIVTMQHPNPYFDDSYAVNSENVGPYGDALTQELMPAIEREFRAIGEGWARTVYGGSTGGWESLAWQVFYPEMFNGAWVNCPDPIDFRYYQLINLYEDDNAFYPDSEYRTDPIRPFMHEVDGEVLMTVQQASRLETVLGTRGRSGQQLDVWQAVYTPVAEDGYPTEVWDRETGEINQEVVGHMRENYDLSHIIRRDWQTLGPKLEGKLHLAVGDEDNFYLEEAVMLLEDFLQETSDPPWGGTLNYGYRHPHCYSGPPDDQSVRLTRLTYNQRLLPQMEARLLETAPPGADMSWRY